LAARLTGEDSDSYLSRERMGLQPRGVIKHRLELFLRTLLVRPHASHNGEPPLMARRAMGFAREDQGRGEKRSTENFRDRRSEAHLSHRVVFPLDE